MDNVLTLWPPRAGQWHVVWPDDTGPLPASAEDLRDEGSVMARWRRIIRGLIALGAVVLLAVAWLARPASSPVLATATLGPASFTMAVALGGGRAFVGPGRDGRVAVVDLNSGSLLRTVTLAASSGWPGASAATPAVDDHARLIFLAVSDPNSGERIAILDATNGLPRGSISLGTNTLGGAVDTWLAADTARQLLVVLTGTSPGWRLLVYDYGHNRLLRSVPLASTSGATVGATGGFFGFGRGAFGGMPPEPLALDATDGRIVVSRDDGTGVDLIDLTSGRLLRTVTVGPPSTSGASTTSPPELASPVVDERRHRIIVAVSQGGDVATLDARTGRVLHIVPTGWGAAAPTVDVQTGRAFVWLSTGLGVLDSSTGRLLTTVSLAGGGPVALDPRSGQVYAATPGAVVALDGRSGRLLRSLPVQGNVASLAVDGATGRLFVLTGSSVGFRTFRRGGPQSQAQLLVFDTRTGALRRTLALGTGFGRLELAPSRGRAVLLLVGSQASLRTDMLGWLPSWLRRIVPGIPGITPSRPTPAAGSSFQFARRGPLLAHVSVLDTSRL